MARKPRGTSTVAAKEFFHKMEKVADRDTFSFIEYPILSPFRRCKFNNCNNLAVGEYCTAEKEISEGLCDKHRKDVLLAAKGM